MNKAGNSFARCNRADKPNEAWKLRAFFRAAGSRNWRAGGPSVEVIGE